MCRHCPCKGKVETIDAHKITREAAKAAGAELAGSDTTSHSASTQSKKELRDTVWPTDIFGNKDDRAEIVHLLPAGKEACKEWIHVAAAVVGLEEQSTTEEKKKATRGIYGEPKPAQAY